MSVRQAVSALRSYYQEEGLSLEETYGPEAVSAARDLASMLSARLGEESPYVTLWADFEADPRGTAAQLTGALEALVEADPALGRRLEGFVREWEPVSGPPGSAHDPAAQEVVGEDEAWGSTVALEPNPDVGQGAYLYGNLEPGSVTVENGGEGGMARIEGLDHVERLGLDPSRVRQLRDDLYGAIESHPGIDPVLERDLKGELEDALDEAAMGERADADRLGRNLRNIGRMHPDILRALLDRLDDPELGWGELGPEGAPPPAQEA